MVELGEERQKDEICAVFAVCSFVSWNYFTSSEKKTELIEKEMAV